MSNINERINSPLLMVQGEIVGEKLLATFKSELIKETVFQKMFGTHGERIFDQKLPSLNQTITPCLVLRWRDETFKTYDNYLEGTVVAELILPVQLTGDFNSLRRVATILQRWMAGRMDLFTDNKGLIAFGYGANFNYEGMAKFDGFACPVIQITLPFKYDLAKLRGEFDIEAPLDEADIGFVESFSLEIFDQETDKILIEEGVLVENN